MVFFLPFFILLICSNTGISAFILVSISFFIASSSSASFTYSFKMLIFSSIDFFFTPNRFFFLPNLLSRTISCNSSRLSSLSCRLRLDANNIGRACLTLVSIFVLSFSLRRMNSILFTAILFNMWRFDINFSIRFWSQ